MSFYLQVLCTDSVDSTACTVVATDSHRVLINCGEGVQRLCVEHKVRLGKISALMFTEFSPQCCLGLPGLALTVADAGNANIAVSGPAQLESLLDATRHFMKLPDGLLRLNRSIHSDKAADTANGASMHVVFESTELLLEQVNITTATPSTDTTGSVTTSRCCFIGHSPELQGKFDIKRAESFNVPKGPLFGKLKKGESITLADGTVIRPEQVLGECEPSRCFAVVCRVGTEEKQMLQQLVTNAALNRHCAAPDGLGDMLCMVHLSPAETVYSTTYQAWIQRFGPQVTHIFSGAGCCAHTHTAFAATTTHSNKMHLASPALFPQLRHTYHGLYPTCQATESTVGALVCEQNVISGVPGLKYHFLPLRNKGVEPTAAVDCAQNASLLWQEALDGDASADITHALAAAYLVQDVAMHHTETTEPHHAAQDQENVRQLYGLDSQRANLLTRTHGSINFLGTGCAIPSKYRNVSGVLVQLQRGALLIDAGEGTWAQMVRMQYEHMAKFAIDNTAHSDAGDAAAAAPTLVQVSTAVAQMLRVVWISHPHADHHLGLVRVILERKAALLAHQTLSTATAASANSARNTNEALYKARQNAPTTSCCPEIFDMLDTMLTDNDSNGAAPSTLFEPLVVIAPPSVLAFLVEYAVLDNSIVDAYIGVSCRSYDSYDDCLYTDAYWNDRTFSSADHVQSVYPQGANSTEPSIQVFHESKRQRVATSPHVFLTTMLAAPEQAESHSSHSANSMDVGTPQLVHQQDQAESNDQPDDSIHSDQRRKHSHKTKPTDAAVVDHLLSGGRSWRNFAAVFREEVSPHVHAQATQAKLRADTVLQDIGVMSLRNVQVVHCGQSYGLCIEVAAGLENSSTSTATTTGDTIKIVYSGDTRPCARLVELGRHATVLIHEATFEDDKAHEAVSKRHSTMGEAALVGRAMDAYRVIFTHFSQRYPGVPLLNAPPALLVPSATVTSEGGHSVGAPHTANTVHSNNADVNVNSVSSTSGAREHSTQHGTQHGGGGGYDNRTTAEQRQFEAQLADLHHCSGSVETEVPQPILAFDFMHLSFRDLLWAPAVTAVFASAFPGARKTSGNDED